MANEDKSKKVKARVLVDCEFGKCNEVITLDADVAEGAKTGGQIDTAPAAVAYAESIAVASKE